MQNRKPLSKAYTVISSIKWYFLDYQMHQPAFGVISIRCWPKNLIFLWLFTWIISSFSLMMQAKLILMPFAQYLTNWEIKPFCQSQKVSSLIVKIRYIGSESLNQRYENWFNAKVIRCKITWSFNLIQLSSQNFIYLIFNSFLTWYDLPLLQPFFHYYINLNTLFQLLASAFFREKFYVS